MIDRTFSSVVQSCLTLCDSMDYSKPGFPVHHQVSDLAETYVDWVSDAIQPSYPLSPLLPLPSIFPSIRVFSIELALHIRRLKYGSFNLSISPSKEYWGLIFFRTDWFYGLAIQDTLKSLLQHHNSKALILWCSAFIMAQISHPYMTTGKPIAFTTRTFVGKVMYVIF